MTPTATTPQPDDSRGSIAARNERGADRGAESGPGTQPDDSRGSIAARDERGADRGAESGPGTQPDDSRGSIAARNKRESIAARDERGADCGAESGPGTQPDVPGVDDDALQRCADEPIAVPGAIQPHGALLAVTEPDLAVVVASANAAEVLGDDVGDLAALLGPADRDRLRAGLAGDLVALNPMPVPVAGRDLDLVVHRTDGLLVTEWEPVAGAGEAGSTWHRRLPSVLQRLSATQTLDELTAVLARDVRGLTGFDRVMVYRFDPEWNGEVVAEDRRADLEPFLGLRYPASDIPAQARALYATNWLRLIPDATYRRVPLEPAVNPVTGRPLDLSGAMLRSVSPVHLEYLANMGVVASMSVSLLDRRRLWGLIACHSYRGPHRPSYADRVAAEFLGRTASLLLQTTGEAGEQGRVVAVAQRRGRLGAALRSGERRGGEEWRSRWAADH